MSNERLGRKFLASSGPWPGIAPWAAGLVLVAALDDPRRRFPAFSIGFGLAALGWLWLSQPRISRGLSQRAHLGLVVAAVAARLFFLFQTPAFSDDVFRYVFEGRVAWREGLGFPFRHAPSEAPALGIPGELLDESWLRINHAHIPTIYPPLSQLVFVAAGGLGDLLGGGHLVVLKSFLLVADLSTWGILALALRRGGRPAAGALVWGLSPLPILEIAREGHADALAAAALATFGGAFVAGRSRLGFAGLGLAALAKLNGLLLLPVALRSTRRGAWIALFLASALVLPWALAGSHALSGLTNYATRWQAGDGAFSILLLGAEGLLGGDWARFGALTLTRHQLARALVFLVFGGFVVALLRKRLATEAVPAASALALLVFLLLAPTVHPWYLLWLLALAPFAMAGRRSILALGALAALLHHPGYLELSDGIWTDLPWIRALVHGPAWFLLLGDLVRGPGLGYATPPVSSGRD